MKAIMIYNLPEDIDNYVMNFHSFDYWSALWDMDMFIRATYNGKNDICEIEDKAKLIDTVCEKWFEILKDKNIDLDEIS